MYRLTVSGTPVTAWRAAHASAPTAWMRVYRWENKWGLLRKTGRWEDVWRAEIRTPLAHSAANGAEQLFESLESIQSSAPPPAVDDMWDEEIAAEGNISCNASLSITGTMFEIQRAVRDLGITLAPAISDTLSKIDRCNPLQATSQPEQQPLQRVQPPVQHQQPRLQIQEMTQGSQPQPSHPRQPRRPPHTSQGSQQESTHAPRPRQFQSRNGSQGQERHSRPTHASSPRMQSDSSQNRQYAERPSTGPRTSDGITRTQSHQSRPRYQQPSVQPVQQRGLLPTPQAQLQVQAKSQ